MIVKMLKTHVVARLGDRQRLLEALRELGVVHLTPIDPREAVAGEETLAAIDGLGRAAQLVAKLQPAGPRPDLTAAQAAEEVLRIQRDAAERRSRLSSLHQQIGRLAVWGDVTVAQFEALREAGWLVRAFSVPAEAVDAIGAECVQPIAELSGGRWLVVAVTRGEEPELPEGCEPVERPARDRPGLRAEAAEIERANQADEERLQALAHLAEDMKAERTRLRQKADFTVASRSGAAHEDLYAVQGWVPAEQAEALAAGLAGAGVDAAVQTLEPAEGDSPPTLISYPRWSRPIQGLFDILGTLPGYEEYDLSAFFMVAMPLFAAMLIGDAGYGLIFLLIPLLAYRRLLNVAGAPKTHLLIVVGAATMVWGILTANYFGVTPNNFRGADGSFSGLGAAMKALGILWHPDEETARFLIIKVSFILGSIHLILAHVRQAAGYWPHAKAWSEVGWCAVLAGMLGLIWKLFEFPIASWLLLTALVVLAVGYVTAVLFSFPEHRLGKRIAFGFAASLLPFIGTFGDTMSYIRLMAVGLASYYIAAAFNGLGAMIAAPTAWLWLVGVPIIVFGHALNIALAVIGIFAHGVRLNMLEFSNNAGIQWAGHPYEPFGASRYKEQ